MAGKRGRRHHEEEHENHERWLVTYADMVTLLMVLFIVMFAMSAVDEKKFNALKSGLAAGFGQSTSILDGSSAILEQPGMAIAAPIAPSMAVKLPPGEQVKVSAAVAKDKQLEKDRRRASADSEVERLTEIWKRIRAALAKRGLTDDVKAVIDERGLVLSLVSRHVVFENDVAELSPRGRRVVLTLAPVLATLEESLTIDGHTNQVKVQPKYFPTDWELSAARAVRVLRLLNESGRIPNARMTATAYGHERPLINPARAGSQRINKRVDIVVATKLPEETRRLMGSIDLDKIRTGAVQP